MAILAAVGPGQCIYGWGVLTEPLFALLVVVCAWSFVRAVQQGRRIDFLLCGVLGAATFWIRPFGLASIVACLCGAGVWGISRRRWGGPLCALLGVVAMFGPGWALKAQLERRSTGSPYPPPIRDWSRSHQR